MNAEKARNVNPASQGQGHFEEQYEPTTMIFGVVIGILHGSGHLTDKQMIWQELTKWLLTAEDRELKCYTMCIWFTAQCLTQSQRQKSTVSTPEIATTTSTSTQTLESTKSAITPFVEICGQEGNVSEITTSVSANADVEQSRDCNPQISAVGVVIGTTFFAATPEMFGGAQQCYYAAETPGHGSCAGQANCVKTEHNVNFPVTVAPVPINAETERLNVVDSKAQYEHDDYHTPKKRLHYMPENSNTARIITSEISTDGAINAINTLDEQSPCNQISDEGAVLREDYPVATLLKSSRGISHTERISTELATDERVNNPAERKPYSCDVCGLSFHKSWHLHSHLFKHKDRRLAGANPQQCNVCGIWFGLPDSLRAHQRRRHAADEKQYRCFTCGSSFSQLGCLETHECIHSGEKPQKRKICRLPVAESDRRERPYKCDVCDVSCLRAADLRVHVRRHTGEKPFECDMCGAAFSMSCNLRDHKRRHTGEKPHKCGVCGWAFARSSTLRRHEYVHLQIGTKRYQCDVCGVDFTQADDLRRHECHLTGELPLKIAAAANSNVNKNIIGEVICVGMGLVVKNDNEQPAGDQLKAMN